jgi:hypothetical protein
MSCKKCRIDPTYHNFLEIGKNNGVRYFYTSSSRGKDISRDGSNLESFKEHLLDTKNESWEWIVDFNYNKLNESIDTSYMTGVIKYLSETHKYTLRKVYFINMNIIIKASVSVVQKLFKQSIFDKIEYLNGSPLELYIHYEKKGFHSKMIKWLNSIDYNKSLPPVPIFL